VALKSRVESQLHAVGGLGAVDFSQEFERGEVVVFEVKDLAAEAFGFAFFGAEVGFEGVAVEGGDVGQLIA